MTVALSLASCGEESDVPAGSAEPVSSSAPVSDPTPTPTPEPTPEPDTEAPVFEGVDDVTVYAGNSFSYRSDVTATDAVDGEVSFQVDSSNVNLSAVGSYVAVYTATDAAGNAATVKRKIKVVEKPKITEESTNAAAQKILKNIITEEMSPAQKAEAIFKWTSKKIAYRSVDEAEYWEAAYNAITLRRGDCFNYYAASKVMLDLCGIENMMVERYVEPEVLEASGEKFSTHYWLLVNVGTGWYHFDACPHLKSQKTYHCFMQTDAQIEAYAATRPTKKWYYRFDPSLYPERATEEFTVS